MTQRLSWSLRLLLRFFRLRLKHVGGAENLPTGPFILASNHVDFLDAFAIGAALVAAGQPAPVVLTQTANYAWTGLTIPIDPQATDATLATARQVLARGGMVLNFPEGQRNGSPTLLPGKTGTVRLALASNLPIAPVGIVGPRPSRLFVQSLWQYLTRRRFVTVSFGTPLVLPPMHEPTREDLGRLTHELMGRIADRCEKERPRL